LCWLLHSWYLRCCSLRPVFIKIMYFKADSHLQVTFWIYWFFCCCQLCVSLLVFLYQVMKHLYCFKKTHSKSSIWIMDGDSYVVETSLRHNIAETAVLRQHYWQKLALRDAILCRQHYSDSSVETTLMIQYCWDTTLLRQDYSEFSNTMLLRCSITETCFCKYGDKRNWSEWIRVFFWK